MLRQLDFAVPDSEVDWLVESLPDTPPLIGQRLARLTMAASQQPGRAPHRVALKRWLAISDDGLRDSRQGTQNLNRLLRLTARQFGLPVASLTGKSRKQENVRARSIGMFVAREHLHVPVRDIGRLFGNRDPSTVRHACRQIKLRLLQEAELAVAVRELLEQFNADREARLCDG